MRTIESVSCLFQPLEDVTYHFIPGQTQSYQPLAPSLQVYKAPDVPYSWHFTHLYEDARKCISKIT